MFISERHNVFTEEINKTEMMIKESNKNETCEYGASKDLVSEKKVIHCHNIIQRYKK